MCWVLLIQNRTWELYTSCGWQGTEEFIGDRDVVEHSEGWVYTENDRDQLSSWWVMYFMMSVLWQLDLVPTMYFPQAIDSWSNKYKKGLRDV